MDLIQAAMPKSQCLAAHPFVSSLVSACVPKILHAVVLQGKLFLACLQIILKFDKTLNQVSCSMTFFSTKPSPE